MPYPVGMIRLLTASALLFQFHSNFWYCLHHFLYNQSRLRHAAAWPALAGLAADTGLIAPADRPTWDRAVTYYDTAFASHEIDFDTTMNPYDLALADSDLTRLPAPLRAALEAAAPIYRRTLWARHDSANQAWVGSMRPWLAEYGDTLRRALVRAYHVPWPGDPVRVEVVPYANLVGAYTIVKPTLVTISSLYKFHQGSLGLEQLMHESSHAMMDSIDAGLPSVRDRYFVEHVINFFTAGELVRREIPTHKPYAEVRQLWTWKPADNPVARYYPTVAPIWREYLDHKLSFHDALERIQRAYVPSSR